MTRPTLDSISMIDSAWVSKINSNFYKLLNSPFPIAPLTKTLTKFDQDPRAFNGCFSVFEGHLYTSNGSNWVLLGFEILNNIANLDPLTATVADIKTAYNTLLADLQAKSWMAS